MSTLQMLTSISFALPSPAREDVDQSVSMMCRNGPLCSLSCSIWFHLSNVLPSRRAVIETISIMVQKPVSKKVPCRFGEMAKAKTS